jgi:hypothetical protein
MRTLILYLSLLLIGLLPLLSACDSASPDLAGPELASAVRGGQERVAVCHYDADADAFKLITVAAPAVEAHLRQGGALPGTNGLDENCQPTEPPPTCTVGADVPGQQGYIYDEACEPVLATCPCSYAGLPDSGRDEMIFEYFLTGTWNERATNFSPGGSGNSATVGFSSYGTNYEGVCVNRINFEHVEQAALSSIAQAEACRVALYALNDGWCFSSDERDNSNDLCEETYFETFGE